MRIRITDFHYMRQSLIYSPVLCPEKCISTERKNTEQSTAMIYFNPNLVGSLINMKLKISGNLQNAIETKWSLYSSWCRVCGRLLYQNIVFRPAPSPSSYSCSSLATRTCANGRSGPSVTLPEMDLFSGRTTAAVGVPITRDYMYIPLIYLGTTWSTTGCVLRCWGSSDRTPRLYSSCR